MISIQVLDLLCKSLIFFVLKDKVHSHIITAVFIINFNCHQEIFDLAINRIAIQAVYVVMDCGWISWSLKLYCMFYQ